MSKDIVVKNSSIAMTPADIAIAQSVEDKLIPIKEPKQRTHHNIHGGIYARTIFMKKGEVVSGVIIKVATTMIVSGKVKVLVGSNVLELEGYHVLSASANRKQVVTALEDTHITMLLVSDAKTKNEAEDDFTDEADRLVSRQDYSINEINITGEVR